MVNDNTLAKHRSSEKDFVQDVFPVNITDVSQPAMQIGVIEPGGKTNTKGEPLEQPTQDGPVQSLSNRSLSSKKQASASVAQSCRSLSTRRTSKSDPYNALFTSYLHPMNYEDSSNANLLYMLALNEEEIEMYELKKKQYKLKRRLKYQCKNNGKIDFNAKEWMKRWDEDRRVELVEEALREAAEEEAREKRRKEREKEKKGSNFKTDVYSSDEET